jgi:hypothetical protein
MTMTVTLSTARCDRIRYTGGQYYGEELMSRADLCRVAVAILITSSCTPAADPPPATGSPDGGIDAGQTETNFRDSAGDPLAPDETGTHNVTVAAPGEIRLRLSRFLWGGAELPSDIDSSEFTTVPGIAARAVQMVNDPRAGKGVDGLTAWWLGLDELATVQKQHPRWSNDLRQSLRDSVQAFTRHVILEDGGLFGTLFTAPYAFADSRLAPLYGMLSSSPTLQKIPLNPMERLGLLAQVGVLARFGPEGDPVWPARWVWPLGDTLLCDTTWKPGTFPLQTFKPGTDRPVRDQLEEITARPPCSTCHPYVNPFGYAFTRFDSIGMTAPGSQPANLSGVVKNGVDGRELRFDGQPDLMKKLVATSEFRACIVRRTLTYALYVAKGTNPNVLDAQWPVPADVADRSLQWLRSRFDSTSGDIKDLLASTAQTEAFVGASK